MLFLLYIHFLLKCSVDLVHRKVTCKHTPVRWACSITTDIQGSCVCVCLYRPTAELGMKSPSLPLCTAWRDMYISNGNLNNMGGGGGGGGGGAETPSLLGSRLYSHATRL